MSIPYTKYKLLIDNNNEIYFALKLKAIYYTYCGYTNIYKIIWLTKKRIISYHYKVDIPIDINNLMLDSLLLSLYYTPWPYSNLRTITRHTSITLKVSFIKALFVDNLCPLGLLDTLWYLTLSYVATIHVGILITKTLLSLQNQKYSSYMQK